MEQKKIRYEETFDNNTGRSDILLQLVIPPFLPAHINEKTSFIPRDGNPEVPQYSQPNRTIVLPMISVVLNLFEDKVQLFRLYCQAKKKAIAGCLYIYMRVIKRFSPIPRASSARNKVNDFTN